jgi:hypothetical protein
MEQQVSGSQEPQKQSLEDWVAEGGQVEWVRPRPDPYTLKPFKVRRKVRQGQVQVVRTDQGSVVSVLQD